MSDQKIVVLDGARTPRGSVSGASTDMPDVDLDPAKTNPYGGAIVLGHPVGATGARPRPASRA